MRSIGEISHPEVKITVMCWNQKYLVKFERGPVEQTYKIREDDVFSIEELKRFVSEELAPKVLPLMSQQEESLSLALNAVLI